MRIGENGSISSKTITPDKSSIGVYTQSDTDFTLGYKNISFDFTRTYNNQNKKWYNSTDSSDNRFNYPNNAWKTRKIK